MMNLRTAREKKKNDDIKKYMILKNVALQIVLAKKVKGKKSYTNRIIQMKRRITMIRNNKTKELAMELKMLEDEIHESIARSEDAKYEYYNNPQ